jgi:hypothetical protein
MADKLDPVSPARKLQQQLNDLEAQHAATGGWETLPQHSGPMPTIYNVNRVGSGDASWEVDECAAGEAGGPGDARQNVAWRNRSSPSWRLGLA